MSSEPGNLFDAVRMAGMTDPQEPFTVHVEEATPERLSHFPHILTVPTYDIVKPIPPGHPHPIHHTVHTQSTKQFTMIAGNLLKPFQRCNGHNNNNNNNNNNNQSINNITTNNNNN